jgi:hypothetical protein
MTRKSKNKVPAKLKWMAAIGALTASTAALITNAQTILTAFDKLWSVKTAINVNVGWLTISDPEDIACISKQTRRFELSKGRFVSLLDNDCLAELLQRAEARSAPQTIGRSFFLLLENRGPRIERVELIGAGQNGSMLSRVPAIDSGTNVAVCMGYEGRGGNSSREFRLNGLRLIPVEGSPETLTVRDPKASQGYGISDCGRITYSYPTLPN